MTRLCKKIRCLEENHLQVITQCLGIILIYLDKFLGVDKKRN